MTWATYSVTVSNANGGWTVSSNATLLAAFAPVIVTQPASQTGAGGLDRIINRGGVRAGAADLPVAQDGTSLTDGGRHQRRSDRQLERLEYAGRRTWAITRWW